MMANIFLRSTLRQPVKAAFLLIVTALVTFAFVARGGEWLLVSRETARLGNYYRAAGTIEQTRGDPWADTGEAAAYLRSREGVAAVNRIEYSQVLFRTAFPTGTWTLRHAPSTRPSAGRCRMLTTAGSASW